MTGTLVYLGVWLGGFFVALGLAHLLIAGLDFICDHLARRDREGWK